MTKLADYKLGEMQAISGQHWTSSSSLSSNCHGDRPFVGPFRPPLFHCQRTPSRALLSSLFHFVCTYSLIWEVSLCSVNVANRFLIDYEVNDGISTT